MPQNIEIKAALEDIDACLKTAQKLSGHSPETIFQDDFFFNCANGRLKLRVFSPDKGQLIFYTRADEAGPKLSETESVTARNAKPVGTAARTLASSSEMVNCTTSPVNQLRHSPSPFTLQGFRPCHN